MFDEYKNKKRIKHMEAEEVGYMLYGSLWLDENGDEWINLNSFVSEKYLEFSFVLHKLSDKHLDYEILTTEDFITANMSIHCSGYSEDFEPSTFMVRTKDFLINKKKKKMANKKKKKISQKEIKKTALSPLKNVFFKDEVLKEVLVKTSVPQIIENKEPEFPGVILHGIPGTGKTELAKTIFTIFENCDCPASELNLAEMSERYVGSLGHNLDEKLKEMLEKTKKNNKPAYIFLDEATSLVLSSKDRGTSADYYQEAIDVLKKYISNYPNLVFVISTNLIKDFDAALIREGRLTLIEIDRPEREQQAAMWKFFLKKYDVLKKITVKQSSKLVDISEKETGAFIDKFCQSYISLKKAAIEQETGSKSFVDVLIDGETIDIEEIKKSIKFKTVLDDLTTVINNKYKNKPTEKKKVGFMLKGR